MFVSGFSIRGKGKPVLKYAVAPIHHYRRS